MLKTQTYNSEHNWKDKLEEDMVNFRKKLMIQNKEMIESIET